MIGTEQYTDKYIMERMVRVSFGEKSYEFCTKR